MKKGNFARLVKKLTIGLLLLSKAKAGWSKKSSGTQGYILTAPIFAKSKPDSLRRRKSWMRYAKYLASLFRVIIPKGKTNKMYFLKKESGLHMHLENWIYRQQIQNCLRRAAVPMRGDAGQVRQSGKPWRYEIRGGTRKATTRRQIMRLPPSHRHKQWGRLMWEPRRGKTAYGIVRQRSSVCFPTSRGVENK